VSIAQERTLEKTCAERLDAFLTLALLLMLLVLLVDLHKRTSAGKHSLRGSPVRR